MIKRKGNTKTQNKYKFPQKQGTDLIHIIHILELKTCLELLKFGIILTWIIWLKTARGERNARKPTPPTTDAVHSGSVVLATCENLTRHFFF